MMADIEHMQIVKAAPEQVYAALATQDGLAEVWTQELRVADAVGGVSTFTFGDETDHMRITELDAPGRIAWHCIRSDPQWVGTDITFDIGGTTERTVVVLKHRNWREVTDFFRSCNYHWGIFLLSLKRYCEEGAGLPYQRRTF